MVVIKQSFIFLILDIPKLQFEETERNGERLPMETSATTIDQNGHVDSVQSLTKILNNFDTDTLLWDELCIVCNTNDGHPVRRCSNELCSRVYHANHHV